MSYCAQGRKGRYPNKSCSYCSLTNYGLDCHNEPVPTSPSPKRLTGMDKALHTYRKGGGFAGQATRQAVLADVGDELPTRLTGHELGLVMLAVSRAYHKGRASHQGIDVVADCVWLPWGGGLNSDGKECGQLIPIIALRNISIIKAVPSVTNYHLDYTE